MGGRQKKGYDLFYQDRPISNLINDHVEGRLTDGQVIFEATVVEIDHIGGVLEEDPPNPRNSIRARLKGTQTRTNIKDLPVFYPFNSHDTMPIKESENVYVIFIDENKTSGLWMTRAAEPNKIESRNITPAEDKYVQNENNDLKEGYSAPYVQDSLSAEESTVSEEFVAEDVGDFRFRVGDRAIEGSNNTLIVLGRDRPADVGSGETEGAGTVDIVTGRQGNGGDDGSAFDDPNLDTDKSRIYISSNTDADANFDIQAGEGAGPSAAIVAKSDEIRIIARNGMKVTVGDGEKYSLTIDSSGNVTLNTEGAIEATAGGDVSVSSDGNVGIDASGDVTVDAAGNASISAADATIAAGTITLDGTTAVGAGSKTDKIILGDSFIDFCLKPLIDILKTGPWEIAGLPIVIMNSITSNAIDQIVKFTLDDPTRQGVTVSASHTVSKI